MKKLSKKIFQKTNLIFVGLLYLGIETLFEQSYYKTSIGNTYDQITGQNLDGIIDLILIAVAITFTFIGYKASKNYKSQHHEIMGALGILAMAYSAIIAVIVLLTWNI